MMTKRLTIALSRKRYAGIMIALFTACLQLAGPRPASSQALQPVNMAIPSKSFQMVIYPLAKERGFMKEEGIDLRVIYISPVTSIQAMLGGDDPLVTVNADGIASVVPGATGIRVTQEINNHSVLQILSNCTSAPTSRLVNTP